MRCQGWSWTAALRRECRSCCKDCEPSSPRAAEMNPRYIGLGVVALPLAIAYGIWYAYSVILVALLAEFGWSRAVVAGAFSVFTIVHGGMNPVAGMLCARFRPLRVMAVGGALMGL